jgi:mRNA interferase HigB
MRIIARGTLRDFWNRHPDAEIPLRSWYAHASRADWRSPADIKAAYRSASFVANNRVVFNIKGNDYRLVAAVHYNRGMTFIRFIGTRARVAEEPCTPAYSGNDPAAGGGPRVQVQWSNTAIAEATAARSWQPSEFFPWVAPRPSPSRACAREWCAPGRFPCY